MIFLGDDGVEGLVARERWMARPGLFERLSQRFELAIFTGRLHYEADITLGRFARDLDFDPIVCAEDVVEPKPSPEGLLKIAARAVRAPDCCISVTSWMTRDAARAAGVPFVGVAHANNEGARIVHRSKANGGAGIRRHQSDRGTAGVRKASIEAEYERDADHGLADVEGQRTIRDLDRHPLLDHMLELFTKHGGFDLQLAANGDLDVDQHHTVEDVGIVLGQLFAHALGDRKGINRAGYFVLPMDETLAVVAVDLGGRPTSFIRTRSKVGWSATSQSELMEDFFGGFVNHAGANLHAKVLYGRSSHHKIEAVFKCFARAMKYACSKDARLKNELPSTKGLL